MKPPETLPQPTWLRMIATAAVETVRRNPRLWLVAAVCVAAFIGGGNLWLIF